MPRFKENPEYIAHYIRDDTELALLKTKAVEILQNELGDPWHDWSDIYKIYSLCFWIRAHMRYRTIDESHLLAVDLLKSGEMMCRGYSRLLVALSYALGYESRIVNLRSEKFDPSRFLPGHFVAEVFIPYVQAPDGSWYKKWVMFDTNFALVICHNGIYQNCLNLYDNPKLYLTYMNQGWWNRFDDYLVKLLSDIVIVKSARGVVHYLADTKYSLSDIGYEEFKRKFYADRDQ